MYPTQYTKPAGHPRCGSVSALGGNSSLPDFYFGEGPLNGLRITSTPQDCHLDASENSNDSINSPESTNAPIAESLNKNLTEVELTKPPFIYEEYFEKKQDLAHEVYSIELLIGKGKGTSLAAPIALISLDLLKPSTVDHNVRGENLAKDNDVLHEVEIVGLHTFQRLPLSLPEPFPPEDPETAKSFSYPYLRPVKAQGGNGHLSVPTLNQLRRLLTKTPEATLSEDNSQAGINQASSQDFPKIS
ncbi:hypothetical protein DSO57_1026470 [Entomophthora muscae]|uniref:Uncharacterized protein n=1 Tax=Entomophthora muscae TaxID=34485 RepID=A0ACC2SRL6_9FUNG|nr:hypothetical protein DSO57_1026470 [Entomophthora muscae]